MLRPVTRSVRTHRWLPQLLSMLLAFTPVFANGQTGAPQQPPAAQPPAAPQPAGSAAEPPKPAALPTVQGLKVIPLAGKGEMNDIERKLMAPLVVEVLDQNDRPVENAEVVFRFPIQGPSAMFPGGKTSQTARTNGQGQAAAMNWIANNELGRFDVHVAASYANQIGEATLSMSNVNKIVEKVGNTGNREKRGWFSPTWVKIAVIAGGAAVAVGIVLATRGGASTGTAATPPTITITPGPPTVGH